MIVSVKMDILDNNSLVNPVSEVINYEVINKSLYILSYNLVYFI